ncbi:MAG: universal stress protein [Halarchaeum sp.]
MYDDILLPVDGSDAASDLVAHVAAVARWADATVHVRYVADTTRDSVTVLGGDVVDALVSEGERIVAETADRLADAGVDVERGVVRGRPADVIVADAADVDLVAMATHGRSGVERFLLGSTTASVVRRSPTPVLTARTGDVALRFPYDRVLLATDGSPTAEAALAYGLDLAAALDADVTVRSVVDTDSLGIDARSGVVVDELTAAAESALDTARRLAVERDVDADGAVVRGQPAKELCEAARDADAVVMGTTGRTGVDRLLLGSVAEAVVRRAPVPVFTVGRDV